MRFLLFLIIASFFALDQAALLPNKIQCLSADKTQPSQIIRENCRDALNRFSASKDNVITYAASNNSLSCGTCTVRGLPIAPFPVVSLRALIGRLPYQITLTTPSEPVAPIYHVKKAWAGTAMHLGIDKCKGTPLNSTIGENGRSLSVLLDYGPGGKCSDH